MYGAWIVGPVMPLGECCDCRGTGKSTAVIFTQEEVEFWTSPYAALPKKVNKELEP